MLRVYSYRVKNSGLLAASFLFSREMLSEGFMFSCGFFVLVKGGLDRVWLLVLSWVFNCLRLLLMVLISKYLVSESRICILDS